MNSEHTGELLRPYVEVVWTQNLMLISIPSVVCWLGSKFSSCHHSFITGSQLLCYGAAGLAIHAVNDNHS